MQKTQPTRHNHERQKEGDSPYPNRIMQTRGRKETKCPSILKGIPESVSARFRHSKFFTEILSANQRKDVFLVSCLTNCMPNNQFKRGELYSFITGKASTAIARNLQKKFNTAGLKITIEQWSVLYHLWKEDGRSQQELCSATFRDKPSITRLVDNLEKTAVGQTGAFGTGPAHQSDLPYPAGAKTAGRDDAVSGSHAHGSTGRRSLRPH